VVTSVDVSILVLWTSGCRLDGRLVDNHSLDLVACAGHAMTPAVIDTSDEFWEYDLDRANGIEEIGVCGVNTGGAGNGTLVTISHGVEGSDVESEVLTKLVVGV